MRMRRRSLGLRRRPIGSLAAERGRGWRDFLLARRRDRRRVGRELPGGAMSYIPGQPVTAVVQRVEIHKLRQGENLILGFSIGGGIDQDPAQNPFSEDKTDKGIYVTRVTEGGPAEVAGLQVGDKIMQVNGWDMTMVTHDQARKRLTKRNEEVVRLLVTRHSLQKAVQQSMMS
ncbi:sialin [Platysternon megacephalum]|uniref:Tax1-binding protein 3 n=1 Tax=Platysternon megacephalum TaxID=55544 RepID=A0A4D9EUG6_9SAUR|nr:sialin [Platysternon megacephalum]